MSSYSRIEWTDTRSGLGKPTPVSTASPAGWGSDRVRVTVNNARAIICGGVRTIAPDVRCGVAVPSPGGFLRPVQV